MSKDVFYYFFIYSLVDVYSFIQFSEKLLTLSVLETPELKLGLKYWQYWNIVIPRKQWIYNFSNSTDFVLLPHLLPSMLGAVHVCERAGHLPLLQWNHPRYQVTRQFICVKDCSDYIFTQLHVYVCMLTVECSLYICPIFVYIRSYINDFVNWSKKKMM